VTIVDIPADMVTAADFDLDGQQEFVIGRRDSPQLYVVSNSFKEYQRVGTIALAVPPVALSNGDFNDDGRPELAVAREDARIDVLASDCGLNFSLTATVALAAPACDLDVQLVGSRPALVVATTACVQILDLAEPVPDAVSAQPAAMDAAIQLESVRQRAIRGGLIASGVTAREHEVLILALQGLTARQIGAKLFIADRTVETHLAHAYSKLGVRSRFELIARISDGRPGPNGVGSSATRG